jgi:hypothetical protein
VDYICIFSQLRKISIFHVFCPSKLTHSIPRQYLHRFHPTIAFFLKHPPENPMIQPNFRVSADVFYRHYYPANLGSNIEAKLNTKKNPHMSVTVVRSGPDANAGSVRIPLRIKGTNPPKLTATNVLAARETPTTNPR